MYRPAPPKNIKTCVRAAPSRNTIPSFSRPALLAGAALASSRHLYGTDAAEERRGFCPRGGFLALEPRVGAAELPRRMGREGDGRDAAKLRPDVGGRRRGPPEVWKVQVPEGGSARRGGRRAGPESKLGVLYPREGTVRCPRNLREAPATVFWLCRAF